MISRFMSGRRDRVRDARIPEDVVAAANPLDVLALHFEGGYDLHRELGAHAA